MLIANIVVDIITVVTVRIYDVKRIYFLVVIVNFGVRTRDEERRHPMCLLTAAGTMPLTRVLSRKYYLPNC